MMHFSELSTSLTLLTWAGAAGAAKEPGAATGVTIGGAADGAGEAFIKRETTRTAATSVCEGAIGKRSSVVNIGAQNVSTCGDRIQYQYTYL